VKTGRVNEALAKVLCYNVCVLIHEAKKNGIDLTFKPKSLENGVNGAQTASAQQSDLSHNNLPEKS